MTWPPPVRPLILASLACLVIGSTGCTVDRTFVPSPDHLHRVDEVASAPDTSAADLLVVSYNIQYGQDVVLALDDLRQAGLDEADVLLIQEMTPAGVDTMAAALGLHARYQPASIHPHHGRPFGNAVLSRWPITATRLHVLPHPHPWTRHRRIAMACDLDVAGRPLRVVSSHLATPVLSQDSRLAQAAAVLTGLADGWDGALVVGGDFNLSLPGELRAVRRHYRRHARLRLVNTGPDCTVRWNIGRLLGGGCRLDLLFQRGLASGSAGVATAGRASDHVPIWAHLHWSEHPTTAHPSTSKHGRCPGSARVVD